jgi:hypothetical protein
MASMDGLGEVRQRREALLGAIGGLEAALAAPSSDVRWRDGLGEALSRLRATIADHIAATEADDGILSSVRFDAPRLFNAVEKLIAEHETLTHDTELLLDRVGAAPTVQSAEDVQELREQGLALLAAVVRHRQRGADLIYEAYNVDVGGPG